MGSDRRIEIDERKRPRELVHRPVGACDIPHNAAILTRQWLMLRCLPREPRKIDTATLEHRLADEGIHLTRRSIQRDLQALSAVFPLVCDDRTKPYGWSWARDAEPFDLPAMDPRTAMTFHLVERHLAPLLPRATYRELEPHLRRAEAVLLTLDDNALARWPNKVRVVADAVPERPPAVSTEVLDAVYAGLLDERVLRIAYRRRGASGTRNYEVHPLGLVFRGPLVYLVCTVGAHTDVITLLLSRAVHAERLDRPRKVPDGFDLDAFLTSGEPGFLLAPEPVRVVARVRRDAAQRLIEAPPRDAEVVDDGPDHVRFSATWPHTRASRAWLLGFGSALEVLEPEELRSVIADELRRAATVYDG